MYRLTLLLVILLMSVFPAHVLGEEEIKPIQLEEIVVTATKTERKVTEVPASVTVITKEEIEQMHVTKIEEIFRNVEGVDFKMPAAGGFPGQIILRGLPPTFAGSTTQYLINGLPVEPAVITNRMAWHLVSPDDIERIEIVRGPASALYGPSAMGGVIKTSSQRRARESHQQMSQ